MASPMSRPAFAAGLGLQLIVLLSIVSSTIAQEPPDSAALADSAKILSDRADHASQQGTREGLERALEMHRAACDLYRRAGDRSSEATALGNAGNTHGALGQPDSGLALHRRALVIHEQIGDRQKQGHTLANIGNAYSNLRHPDSALVYYDLALQLSREVGDRRAEGVVLNNVGRVHRDGGRPDSALTYFRKALAITQEVGDRREESKVWDNLGGVHNVLGRPDSALACFQQGLLIDRELDDRRGERGSLNNMGVVHSGTGHPDSALSYFRQALAIARELGDRRSEGATLGNVGAVHEALGRPDSALVYHRWSLAIAQESGDRRREANALNNIAVVYGQTGRPDSALVYLQRASPIYRELGQRLYEAITLGNMGYIHAALGRPDSALAHYREALAIHREVGHRGGQGQMLVNIGASYRNLGHLDSALVYFRGALGVEREVGDRRGEGNTLGNLGSVYRQLGRPDSALVYLRQALAIRRDVGDKRGEGNTLGEVGNLFVDLGRRDSALAYYRVALVAHREVGDRVAEGNGLGNIAVVQLDNGHPDSALVHLREALTIFQELGDPYGVATTLSNIGAAHGDLGRPDSALAYYRQSLLIARDVGGRSAEGSALVNIGAVHSKLGRADSSRIYYEQALAIQREVGDRGDEGHTLGNLGSLYHRRFTPTDAGKATAYYDSAAAVRASIASRAGSDPNRLSYAEQFVGLYENWSLAWLARSEEVGRAPSAMSALGAAERGRAQALLDLLSSSAGEAEAVQIEEQALTTPGADLAAEGARLVESVTQSGAAGLSYLVTDDTLLIWLIEPSGEVTVARQAVPSDSVVALVRELRAGLGADDLAAGGQLASRGVMRLEPIELLEGAMRGGREKLNPETAAEALTKVLLPPEVSARLPESGELVIVPQGRLALVPFSVLPLGNRDGRGTEKFGNPYAIRYAPSLATLALTQARPSLGTKAERTQAFSQALLVGNPKMPSVQMATGERSELAPLPDAEAETGWLADRLRATVLTGSDATESAIRHRIVQSKLVHLATHGYAYSSDALARKSFVALTPDEDHDGFLTVGEILDDPDLTLSAELVVLSACQTGLGDLKEAEGTIGFQRSFLAKGARSVLVSLWNISDEATVRLMKAFYTHWLDDADAPTKAEALRRAQDDLRNTPGFEHPLYWAAFQLVGAN